MASGSDTGSKTEATATTTTTVVADPKMSTTAAKEGVASGDTFVNRFYDISAALTAYMEQQQKPTKSDTEAASSTSAQQPATLTAEQAASMYDELLAVKEVGRACKLSAQLLPKFISLFPNKVEQAGNALFDLCEDPTDVGTRILAVRALPMIARAFPDWAPKAADVVVQLLAAEITLELDNVKENLIQLLLVDKKGILEILFNYIIEGNDLLRSRCISFLQDKVLPNTKSFGSPEETEQIIKRVMGDVSAVDLHSFFNILDTFSMFRSTDPAVMASRGDMVSEMLLKQADFSNLAVNEDNLSILLECCEMGAKYSAKTFNDQFIEFFMTKIFPVVEREISEAQRQLLLMRLVDMAGQIDAKNAEPILEMIFRAVLEPKVIKQNAQGEFDIDYTQLEILLLGFHRLAAKIPSLARKLSGIHISTGQPDDFAADSTDPRHAQFREKLKQVETDTFKHNDQARRKRDTLGHTPTTSKEILKERELLDLLIRITNNIKIMVQALLRKPPTFETSLKPSWIKIDVVIVKNTASDAQTIRKRPFNTPISTSSSSTTTSTSTASITTTTTAAPSAPKRSRQDAYIPPGRRNPLPPVAAYAMSTSQQRQQQQQQHRMVHVLPSPPPMTSTTSGTRDTTSYYRPTTRRAQPPVYGRRSRY
ncbi:Apoptosis inhibitor 5 [Pelomyxa schiedti]|nr:Apoptosis inhibitor 5 [Pelomyxa schiedti]